MEVEQLYQPNEETSVDLSNNTDISQLCRICGNASEYLIPIFEGEGLENELEMKIKKHLPIQVSREDEMPINLCYQCASTLIAWHDLTLGCIQADKKLQHLVRSCFKEESSAQDKIEEGDGVDSIEEMSDIEIEFEEEEEVTTNPSTSSQVNFLSSTSNTNEVPVVLQVAEEKNQAKEVERNKNSAVETTSSERCPKSFEVIQADVLRNKIKIQNYFSLLKEETLLKCSHCGKTFTKRSELRDHSAMKDNLFFNCPKSSEVILEAEVLNNKIKIQNCFSSSKQETLLRCSHCEKTFSKKIELKDHSVLKCNWFFRCPKSSEVINDTKVLSNKMKIQNYFSLSKQEETLLKCSHCEETFSKKSELRDHLVMRNNLFFRCPKSFQVLHEPEVLSNKTEIQNNFSLSKPETYIKCSNCEKTFSKESELKDHSVLRGNWFFRCPDSSEVFHEPDVFNSKIKIQKFFSLSKKETLLKCSHCGKTFSKKSELATHLSKIHSNNVFHCELCDTLFHHNKSLFVDHMKWHQQTSAAVGHADNLDKKTNTFPLQSKSKNKKQPVKFMAVKKHSNKDSQSTSSIKKEVTLCYPCEDCGKVFHVLSLYNKHLMEHKNSAIENHENNSESSTSSDEKQLDIKESVPYRCEECNKSFKLKESFKSHQRRHTGEKPFTCHICGKRFAQNGGLSYHLKHVHFGIKEHGCDICGRTFAMKAAMEDHRRIHTGERPYVCHSCGKSFKTKASLYIHSKTHTDDFPHSCTFCHRRFRWKQQLLGHLTTHTGEKNHTCDICGKRFGVKNDLTRHKRIHSDAKPFKCPLCTFPFAQKRYLKNHMKARHRIKYVESTSGPIN